MTSLKSNLAEKNLGPLKYTSAEVWNEHAIWNVSKVWAPHNRVYCSMLCKYFSSFVLCWVMASEMYLNQILNTSYDSHFDGFDNEMRSKFPNS